MDEWPDGWRETRRGDPDNARDCRCGQPVRGTDGTHWACDAACASDEEARMQARIAPYLTGEAK